MGFSKPDLNLARSAIGSCLVEIKSPYNDGWTASSCKHDLYLLKCWLDEQYANLPKFTGEEQWEQQRVFERLKQVE